MAQPPDQPLVLLLLLGAAGVEYLVPPFPGDSITLLGAVFCAAYDWSYTLVFGAVMLGSVAGSMLAFAVGRGWERRRARAVDTSKNKIISESKNPLHAKSSSALDRALRGFEKHGAAYLLLNRFLPGIRPIFFVAAGLVEMKPRTVLLYSALSAAAWNLLLFALGGLLGANVERLEWILRRYSLVAWIGIALLGAIAVWRWRRRRTLHRSEEVPPTPPTSTPPT